MRLNELFNYKNQLMKDICSNERIVKLITDRSDSEVPNHTLPYSQVFPFEFVPETVDDGQTFVCFDVDVESVDNRTFYNPVLYIWIFTHKSKLRLPEGGVRTDEIASAIDDVLNCSRVYGLGELSLNSVDRFVPTIDYQGRVLVYIAKDFNKVYSSRNSSPPATRRSGAIRLSSTH